MKCKLSDICSFRKGKVEVESLNAKNYISTENMLPNKCGITEASSLPTVPLTQEYKNGDVLVSNIRPYFKKIWQAQYDGGCSNDVLVFVPKPNTDKDFLYYVLADDDFFTYSMATSKGTKMPRGDKTSIMQYEVPMIDLQVQEKIASVLKALDKKIELNNEINNNLEQQAQAVYYKMFSEVNGEPVELSGIIDVRDGTHDSPKAQATGYYLITSKHLLPFGVDKASANRISKADFDKINERSLVETQDILMSMIGTIGLISYIPYKAVDFAIKNVALFKTSHTPELAYYFLCYLKSEKALQHIEKCLAGSTQKYISLGELRKMPIYSPTADEIREFNYLVKPMFEEIVSRTCENALLAEMRDTLLSKLMSGELDVSGIDL
ncbi:restriction endonuclease subunit S [Mediterraneibacter agrestimuris]|uniref:restriction endonuclease subunit S n=1 Tax=Mediterraneibacter agrestimuris TaxID=2941333 RepID=UPI00203F8872|nr:restriction endonuclease subunit S [Mediterraneibacter agrestimuris]